MIALSIIVFAIVVVSAIWLPLQGLNANYDPETYTRNLIMQELLRLRNSDQGFESSGAIAEAAALNENLLVYFESAERVFELGGPPRWRDLVDFNHPDLLSTQASKDNPCSRGTHAFASAKFVDEFGTEGISFRRECGSDSYYLEISGVQTPVSRASNPIGLFPEPIFWSNLAKPVIAASAILMTAILVIAFGLRGVMRITRVAHSIDLDATDVQLPDDGIPAEVVPLVKAVNSMLDRVQETREQQQFFLATAAHEIRTPLAIMRVRLEELEDVESREVLRNDARNLARLVEDLLRLLSVRNRGRPEGHVDLVELLRKVVAKHAPMAIENGIDVGMEADDDSVVVNGDERLLSIALGNLIKNAISVSQPSGSVDVIVDEKGEILVRDHGPGVPAGRRESIFEPFTKEPPNRKGHGLGLAIVKAVVKLHGGKIRVEDTAGGGATFVMKV